MPPIPLPPATISCIFLPLVSFPCSCCHHYHHPLPVLSPSAISVTILFCCCLSRHCLSSITIHRPSPPPTQLSTALHHYPLSLSTTTTTITTIPRPSPPPVLSPPAVYYTLPQDKQFTSHHLYTPALPASSSQPFTSCPPSIHSLPPFVHFFLILFSPNLFSFPSSSSVHSLLYSVHSSPPLLSLPPPPPLHSVHSLLFFTPSAFLFTHSSAYVNFLSCPFTCPLSIHLVILFRSLHLINRLFSLIHSFSIQFFTLFLSFRHPFPFAPTPLSPRFLFHHSPRHLSVHPPSCSPHPHLSLPFTYIHLITSPPDPHTINVRLIKRCWIPLYPPEIPSRLNYC